MRSLIALSRADENAVTVKSIEGEVMEAEAKTTCCTEMLQKVAKN